MLDRRCDSRLLIARWLIADDMKAKTVFACQECGAQSPKWLGRCPSAAPGTRSSRSAPRRRPSPRRADIAKRYSLAVAAGPQLYADIDTVVAERLTTASASSTACSAAASCRARWCCIGGEPGIGKSTLLLQAAAHFAHDGRSGALQLRRGIRAPDQVARRAARRRARAALPPGRDLPRAHPRGDRPPASRRFVIVDSIQTVFSLQVPVGARQHRPGARGGDAAAVRRQGAEHPDVPRRPRHQGRQPRRPEGARAHRRHGAVFRGREAPRASRRARGEEPLRRGQRARRVRDDRHRPARRCRIRRSCSSPSGASNAPGLGGAVLRRRLAADAGRGPGARQHQHLRQRAADGERPRSEPAVAAARRAREARRAEPGRPTTCSSTSPAA